MPFDLFGEPLLHGDLVLSANSSACNTLGYQVLLINVDSPLVESGKMTMVYLRLARDVKSQKFKIIYGRSTGWPHTKQAVKLQDHKTLSDYQLFRIICGTGIIRIFKNGKTGDTLAATVAENPDILELARFIVELYVGVAESFKAMTLFTLSDRQQNILKESKILQRFLA